VCHDGVFSTQNQWSTEELFFPEHDFGGTLWENREIYTKWDPSLHCRNWDTPMLVSVYQPGCILLLADVFV
jgi:dipeptidyl aminopeptidase/acylaminoacyl peptidase